jgi:Tol biopolymer transport system component
MFDVDEALRRELERAAEPGDPFGVAERIEARVRRRQTRRRVATGALAIMVTAVSVVTVVTVWTGLGGRSRGHAVPPAEGSPGAVTAATSPILFAGSEPSDPGREGLLLLNPSTGATSLVPGTADISPQSPSWSPDGARIAYYEADEPGIHVMSADGSGSRAVTSFGIDPAWSPDGTRIAFSWSPEGAVHDHVYVVNEDGTGLHELGSGAWPAWSPDGARIAFATDDDRLEVMNADGSDAHTLGVDGIRPAWSPDGSEIAFSRDDGIYLVRPDGSGIRTLATGAGVYEDPTWSPDGSMIAFSLDASPTESTCPGGSLCHYAQNDVWVMRADGRDVRRLTDLASVEHPNGGTAPAWAPVAMPLP